MKYSDVDELGFTELADAWVTESNMRPFDYVLAKLLDAFWRGEFEKTLEQIPDHWPRYLDVLEQLKQPFGLPWQAKSEDEEGEINWEGLCGADINDYALPGQEVMLLMKLPRDMIRLWCHDQGYELPHFWFPEEENTRPVGRPSIDNRLNSQLVILAANGNLAKTLKAQAENLHEWACKNLSHEFQIPKPTSIENNIRSEFRRLKAKQKS